MIQALIPLLAAGVSAAGKLGQGVLQGINTRAMNKYNSPEAQVQRAKKAHIPLAATQISSGNQSAVTPAPDIADGAAGHIAQYNTNQKTLTDIGSLKEDIVKKGLENKKLNEELRYYLAGRGQDPGRTNLSSILALEQQIKGLTTAGMQSANTIAGANARNIATKINLENTEIGQRIRTSILNNTRTGIQIEGDKLENAMKAIDLNWRPRMNQQSRKMWQKPSGHGVLRQFLKGRKPNPAQQKWLQELKKIEPPKGLS